MAIGAKAIRGGAAFVEILADDSKARAVLKRFQGHMNSWATSLNNLGRTLILPGLAIALPMLNTIKVFTEFEHQMQRVKARVSDAEKGFAKLKRTAIELGMASKAGFRPSEVAAGMAELAQAGNDTAAILERMPAILNFAAAAEISVAEAAEFASASLNVFNLKGSQLEHVTDIIVKGANDSLSSVSDMAAAFTYAAPQAALLGGSVQELVGVLAELAQKGIRGERAGTTLRGVFSALVDPTDEGGAALRRMGITAVDPLTGKFTGLTKILAQMQRAFKGVGGGQRLKTLGPVFDTRMITGIAALSSLKPGQIEARIASVFDSQGQSAMMAKTQMDSLRGEFKKLIGTLEALQITLTEAVVVPLRAVVLSVRIFLAGIDEWAQRNPTLVKQMFAWGTAIMIAGPALIALSLAIKLVAFALQPVFMVMTGLRVAIFVAGAAFKWLGVLMWAVSKQTAKMLITSLLSVAVDGIAFVVSSFLGMLSVITTGVMFLVSNPIFLLGIAILAIAGYVIYASGVWGKAVAAMGAAWGRFTGVVKNAWAGVVAAVEAGRLDLAFEIVVLTMEVAWLETVNVMKMIWEDFADFVTDVFDQAATNVSVLTLDMVAKFWAGVNEIGKAFEALDEMLKKALGLKTKEEEFKDKLPKGGGGAAAPIGAAGGVGFGGGVAGMAANAVAAGLAFGGAPENVKGMNGLNPRGAGAPALLKAQTKQIQATRKAQDDQANVIDKRLKRADEAMARISPKRGGRLTQFGMPLEEADAVAARQRQFRFEKRQRGGAGGEPDEAQKPENPILRGREVIKFYQDRAAKRKESQIAAGLAKEEKESQRQSRREADKKIKSDKRKAMVARKKRKFGDPREMPLTPEEEEKKRQDEEAPLNVPIPEFVKEAYPPAPVNGTKSEKLQYEADVRRIDRSNIRGKAQFDRKQAIGKKTGKIDLKRRQALEALKTARGESVGEGGDRMGGGGAIDFSKLKTSVSGTFNASAAAGMATGNTFGSRIANATEKTAKELEMLNKKGGGVGK